MKELTATEASRSFSAVLDEAERGETFVVTRGGEAVASIGPAPQANRASVLAFLEAHRARVAVDDPADEDFAQAVADARQQSREGVDGDPWAE